MTVQEDYVPQLRQLSNSVHERMQGRTKDGRGGIEELYYGNQRSEKSCNQY